jgi:uncharacterized protein YegP (UPF0339 family)
MATAVKETPLRQVEPGSALRFAVYEDNSGRFHWRLLASDGRPLATSDDSFASADAAERSASDAARSSAIG